jgi:hypothetical protein
VPYIKSRVPVGESGDWIVERFVVGEPGRSDTPPDPFKSRPGRYTRLRHAHEVFMTDLYYEWWTQRKGILEACRRGGRVMVTGLGLGLVVESMLGDPDGAVEHVTVVELSPDVIRLVGPHLIERFGPRLEIVEGDAFRWDPPPGAHYTVGWHDIWSNPADERAVPEMERLERRFDAYCDWQGCWPREHQEAESSGPVELGSTNGSAPGLCTTTAG